MLCDVCGKNPASLKAVIEGTELNSCDLCAKHGKIVGRIQALQTRSNIKKDSRTQMQKQLGQQENKGLVAEKKVLKAIVNDFSKRLRDKRAKLGLKQEEFAKKLAIKESLLHNFETGKVIPSVAIAEKLERILGIKLIEETEEVVLPGQKSASASGPVTVGDLVKIRSRKK